MEHNRKSPGNPAQPGQHPAPEPVPSSTEPLEPLDHAGMAQSPGILIRPDKASSKWPAIFRALGNHDFRLFWSGNFLSNIGTWMQNVALGWLVLTLTNSPFWLGVVSFVGSIPFLFFTLFGGVIADRVNKRRLLLLTQSAMMLLAFALALLAWLKGSGGHPLINIWEIALISFFNGVAQAMNAPSYQALVPRLVPREDLTNAIALNSAQFNLSRILGPTLGGYAMAAVGVAGNFFLNGVSFLAVLGALFQIHYPEDAPVRHESILNSLTSGLRYVRRHPQMFVLVWIICTSSLLFFPFLSFIPWFVRNKLHQGEHVYGLMLAASGLGSVLGAALVAWQGTFHHRGRIIPFSAASVMLVLIVFCNSTTLWLSETCMFLEGFGMILALSAVTVAMQELASDQMRGRAMSIYATAFLGLPPLGALAAGELSVYFPTQIVLSSMLALAAILFLSIYASSPDLRKLD